MWKDLIYKGLELSDKYEVSNKGDIRNKATGKILKPSVNQNGYYYVCVSLNKSLYHRKNKTIMLHKAVAYSFLNQPNGCTDVDHVNCNKLDNSVENLEWVTHRENSLRAVKKGLLKPPTHSKLSNNQVQEIKELLRNTQMTQSQIARMYGISREAVSQIKTKRIHSNIS